MNVKTLTILVLLIIVLIGGGYLYWNSMNTPKTPNTNQEAAAAGATTPPQVAGQDVTVGTGTEAAPGSTVSVLYTGMLQDGTVFDSSAKNGNQPLVFVLGAEGIIPGFQIGVNGMKEGGKRRIAIPPEFGYGSQDVKDAAGNTVIPANSTIIFDIELVKVENPTATSTTTTPVE